MGWTGELKDIGYTGSFAVGAEYKGVLSAKDEQTGALTEKGWVGKLEEV